METWKTIPGLEGKHDASTEGKFRSRAGRAGSKVKIGDLAGYVNPSGYVYLCLMVHGKRTNFTAHKLIARTFLGECPKGMQINHKNCNKADNRIENLEYVTPAQNLAHARLNRGEWTKHGESHCMAKLSAADIVKIRSSHETHSCLARRYQVNQSTISRILANMRRKQG